jgi:hypothetical protein
VREMPKKKPKAVWRREQECGKPYDIYTDVTKQTAIESSLRE